MTARARLGDTPGFLSNLFTSVEGVLKQDAMTWLVQQYATLQALPQKLVAQRNAIGAVGKDVLPTDALNMAALSKAATTNAQLTSNYSAMIGAVNQAYVSVQQIQASGGSAATTQNAGGIAAAILGAQQFLSGVSDVDSTITGVVDQLLATGAITPAEANSLYAQTQSTTTGWGRYLLYALGIYVAYRLVRVVL